MFKGDVHRFYRQLRQSYPIPPQDTIPQLDHVRSIRAYYQQIDPRERQLLLIWARKEESGIGLIPATLSGVPLIGLLFAPVLVPHLRVMRSWILLLIWAVGGLAFTAGIYLHHRHRAFATLHIEILKLLTQEDRR